MSEKFSKEDWEADREARKWAKRQVVKYKYGKWVLILGILLTVAGILLYCYN